jgi:hypothetical protein
MVAYSFKAQFAAPIVAGTKRQTVRADRKRHARVGETLQLYTGMRTRACRLIGRAVCVGVGEVRLDFERARVSLWTGVTLSSVADLDAYAARDGFDGWDALWLFWMETHPDVQGAFTGVQIEWGETFEPAERQA